MRQYRGVANVSREIAKKYRGVANVSREIAKRYRGVANVARLVFEAAIQIKYHISSKIASTDGLSATVDSAKATITKTLATVANEAICVLYFDVQEGDVVSVDFTVYQTYGSGYAEVYYGSSDVVSGIPSDGAYVSLATTKQTYTKTKTIPSGDIVYGIYMSIQTKASVGDYIMQIDSVTINGEQVFTA